jgi:uncharacterized protein (TIGR02594 family)
MARKSTAKTSTRKRAARKRELVTAANVAGVGDIETFTDIRKLYDRLAKGGKSMQAPDRSRLRLAAASVAMETAAESEAPWFAVARGELGQRDYPGPRHNPRVVEYFNTTSLQANNDETSWCSAFVNWCMLQARQRGTNNAAARSWLGYGQALDNPRPGCIVVLWRQSPSSWKGHVGFFDGFDVGNRIRLLGGNQGGGVEWDEVCLALFPQERVL